MVTMGGALKRKEMISARLGDMLAELYLACAALKRFADTGRPAEDWPLCDHAVRVSLNRADQALKDVIDNFPMRLVGWWLRLKIQPFGVICSKPRDRLAQKVSDTISEPTAARDRLTKGIYVADDIELGKLDHAFRVIAELEPVKAVMRKARVRSIDEAKAQSLITGNEAARLAEAMALVREVCKVDDFAPEELIGRRPAARKAKAA
jgi:acyl-CoA dehydrogenase